MWKILEKKASEKSERERLGREHCSYKEQKAARCSDLCVFVCVCATQSGKGGCCDTETPDEIKGAVGLYQPLPLLLWMVILTRLRKKGAVVPLASLQVCFDLLPPTWTAT